MARSSPSFVLAALAALYCSVANGQTAKQKATYSRMDKAFEFAYERYQWEPVELTTSDGYVLTTFIISKAFDEEMPNPPVII